jgi:DNA-binding MarR family transcriptional regulator
MSIVDSGSSLNASVAAFRRFNRVYTRFIGVLDEESLNSGYSLAEGRVLYELATRQTSTAKEIAVALGMDPAYLSRILARFEKSSLLKRTTSKKDARCAHLALTQKGKSRFENLHHGDPEMLLYSMTRFFKFLPEEQRQTFLRGLSEKAS